PVVHPPRLTPFPYSTLFRSQAELVGDAQFAFDHRRPQASSRTTPLRAPAEATAGSSSPTCTAPAPATSPPGCRDWERRHAACRRDRKSTRLNSSHVTISYAV